MYGKISKRNAVICQRNLADKKNAAIRQRNLADKKNAAIRQRNLADKKNAAIRQPKHVKICWHGLSRQEGAKIRYDTGMPKSIGGKCVFGHAQNLKTLEKLCFTEETFMERKVQFAGWNFSMPPPAKRKCLPRVPTDPNKPNDGAIVNRVHFSTIGESIFHTVRGDDALYEFTTYRDHICKMPRKANLHVSNIDGRIIYYISYNKKPIASYYLSQGRVVYV
jgi:hypothetical protein